MSEKLVAWISGLADASGTDQTIQKNVRYNCICNMGRTSRDEGHSTVENQGMYGRVVGLGHLCIDSVECMVTVPGSPGGCSRAWIRCG